MTFQTQPIVLCGVNNCRLLSGHKGQHNPYPLVWQFMDRKDRDKLGKAGYATPRGGAKGAYQNHVVRSNRVIIPFEKLKDVNLGDFKNDCVIRLFPHQYFASPGVAKSEFLPSPAQTIEVGRNAFVLYRTHDSFKHYPPLPGWEFRGLEKNGRPVKKRGTGVVDTGHYVLRL